MSNVANCKCSQCSCPECQDLPRTPDQATEVARFDYRDIRSVLNEAHGLIWEDESADNLSNQMELTFRTYCPDTCLSDTAPCPKLGSQWMKYRCDLTGTKVAVRRGAPIPVIAVYQDMDSGDNSLARCFKVHPDFLTDRRQLLEMVAAKLERRVIDGIFEAREALSCFRFMDGRSNFPGVQNGISYPQGDGYRALGRRPVPEKG